MPRISRSSWYNAGKIYSATTTQKKIAPVKIMVLKPNIFKRAGAIKLPTVEKRYKTACVVNPKLEKFLERI